MKINQISILGCGWLGLPLATSWREQGFKIVGSTTSPEKLSKLLALGIVPCQIELGTILNGTPSAFFDSSVLVVTVPPRSRSQAPGIYLEQIKNLVEYIRRVDVLRHVVYTSSTSVYSDKEGLVKEEDVQVLSEASNQELFAVEQLFLSIPHKKISILRLGGLTGGSRMLAKHFAGRKALAGAQYPVNLVHLEDVIAAVQFVVKEELTGVFNVCAPQHPTKKEFYTALASRFQLTSPEFKEDDSAVGKTVDSSKIQAKGYLYQFPDPFLFTYEE